MNQKIKQKRYREYKGQNDQCYCPCHFKKEPASTRKNKFLGKFLKHADYYHLYKEKRPPHIKQGEETNEFSFVLKPSRIGGVGVFATHNIPKGATLNFWNKEDIKFVKRKDIPEDKKSFYKTYCIEQRDGFLCPLQFNRMSIAWYINHSDLPNCDTDEYESRANRDIKVGEELTIDYRYLSDDPKEFNNFPPKSAKLNGRRRPKKNSMKTTKGR